MSKKLPLTSSCIMTVSVLACNQEVTYYMLSYGLQMCQKLNVVTSGQRGC